MVVTQHAIDEEARRIAESRDLEFDDPVVTKPQALEALNTLAVTARTLGLSCTEIDTARRFVEAPVTCQIVPQTSQRPSSEHREVHSAGTRSAWQMPMKDDAIGKTDE